MRVITGLARGRRLKTLPGPDIRPTSDMVREALFDIFQARYDIEGASFLDLYAGTGAVGIEALSRGAAKATFVEESPRTAQVIRANLTHTGLSSNAQVILGDVLKTLPKLAQSGQTYDIIFMDPPYKGGLAEATLEEVIKLGLAKGTVIAEYHAKYPLPDELDNFRCYKKARYGQKILKFYGYGD